MRSAADVLGMMQLTKKVYYKCLEPVCEQFDLTQVELHVLLFLYNHPQYTTAKDICHVRGLTKSYVSKAIDMLTQKNLVTTSKDGIDHRVTHLHLTDHITPIIEQGLLAQEKFIEIIFSGVTKKEMAAYIKVIDKIIDNVKGEL